MEWFRRADPERMRRQGKTGEVLVTEDLTVTHFPSRLVGRSRRRRESQQRIHGFANRRREGFEMRPF